MAEGCNLIDRRLFGGGTNDGTFYRVRLEP